MTFEARGIHKRFGTYRALAGVSLRVDQGELVALLGPSGCGKTTFLRILAGLETPDAGQVLFDGADVTQTPSALRGVGLVFQHYALFEHMTVFENVAFGLRVRRQSKSRIRERVSELLDRRTAAAGCLGPRACGSASHPASRRAFRGARYPGQTAAPKLATKTARRHAHHDRAGNARPRRRLRPCRPSRCDESGPYRTGRISLRYFPSPLESSHHDASRQCERSDLGA